MPRDAFRPRVARAASCRRMARAEAMIAAARPEDVPEILAMIRELAEYERAADQVRATPTMLSDALFGPQPAVFAAVAREREAVVGFALWFRNFSTWEGRHGIYLEDLYVRPFARGGGHGTALLRHLAGVAVRAGCPRLDWSVLDWNEPSIGFYRSLGARPQSDWTGFRLTGAALAALAAGPAAAGP